MGPHTPKKHYCSWASWVSFYNRPLIRIPPLHTHKNAILYTPEYISCTNNDQSLATSSQLNDQWFWDQLIHSHSGSRLWWYFCQFYDTEYLRKMTTTSTFRNRFQHIMRHIICQFISFPFIYNIIIFKAQWDRKIKVYIYFWKKYRPWYFFLRQYWK